MKATNVLLYFFFFQATFAVAAGAARGQYELMCFGLVVALACAAILLGSPQRTTEGRVYLPAANELATNAYSPPSTSIWSAGGSDPLDRYQSVMARLRLSPSTGQTAASLVTEHKHWFNGGEKAAHAFFNHPQVMRALDLAGAKPATSVQTKATSPTRHRGKPTSELANDSFWGNLEQTAANSAPAADGVCGMANCSNEVNAFSFQCFQCRKRVCSSCGNSGVLCRTCAS